MEKNGNEPVAGFSIHKKMMLSMRLTLFLMLFGMLSTHAETYAQKTRLDLNFKDRQIREILNQIEERSEFTFMYDNSRVDVERKVSIDVKSSTITATLDKIFQGTNVTYKVMGRHIMLFADGETSIVQKKVFKVTGKVSDSSGSPLPGASVMIKGTNTGVITDAEGNYSLNDVPLNSTLVFSFVGMKDYEEAMTGQNLVNVTMAEETIGIDEVVAVGYGTVKRRELVGSISKIGGSEINKLPTTSITQSLQGMAAGLNVTNTSGGTPGAENKVSIRGLKSISLSSDPLWIIDGVPLYTASDALVVNGVRAASPLSMINPNDIASIEVLKDASATAIYGNRASGGVIIVTTKSSKKANTDLSVNYDGGISDLPFTQSSIFTNNTEYITIRDEAMRNTGGTEFQPSYFGQQFPNDPGFTREMALNTNSDHLSAMAQTAHFHQFGLSANKGFETGGMLFSLSYRDEEGVLRHNDFKRLTARFSISFKPVDFLEFGANANLMYMNSNGVRTGAGKLAGGWDQWFAMPPFFKLYDENSASGYWFPESGFNAAAYHDPKLIRNNTGDFRTLANTYLQISLPVKGLTIRGEAGTDVTYTNSSYWRSGLLTPNNLSEAQEKAVNRAVFTWNGTVNYAYKGKYIFNGSVRYDGHSALSKDNRWAPFAAAGLGWVVSEENFMESMKWLSNLKLRGSYGTTGNTNMTSDMLIMSWSILNDRHWAGSTITSSQTWGPSGSSDLKWETTSSYDVGFDFGILNDRINGSFAVYFQEIKDLIMRCQVPPSMGYHYAYNWKNVGDLRNKGVEFSISSAQ